jgi:uncharacterized protein (DUF1015 family)
VIGPGTLDHLLAASPYNVVRLILPAYSPGGSGPGSPGGELAAGAAAEDPAAGARAAGQIAAGRLRDWLAEGALAVDGAPALYVYEQRGSDWVQRGLIGLVAVGTDAVHPHEGVMAGPVAGRRELMKATRSNLEPILLVYNGGVADDSRHPDVRGGGRGDGDRHGDEHGDGDRHGDEHGDGDRHGDEHGGGDRHGDEHGSGDRHGDEHGSGDRGGHGGGDWRGDGDGDAGGQGSASLLVDRTAESQEPLACAVTDDGVAHRLWAVTDPAAQADIAADLATRTALIADGHHRYAAYRQLQAEMRASGAGAGAWDYGLAFLVDTDAYPLRLGPIHRVLPRLGPAAAARLAAEAFTVTDLPGDDLGAALAALAKAATSGHAFLLAGGDGFRLLTDPDQAQLAAAMPQDMSQRWRALDASVMQELLLARLWSVRDNVRDVLISHDAAEAARMAADAGGTAVICNPMPLAAVMDIAAHGEQVPRKSTSFGPKPRTGLVLRTFDA